MIGVEQLLADLKTLHMAIDGPLDSGGQRWVVAREFTIPAGRFAGSPVQIAIAAPPDYPATPPGGFYVSPAIVPAGDMGGLNVHNPPVETDKLGGAWQYWSRPLPSGTWPTDNRAKRLLSHWNAVFNNVKA